MLLPTTRPPPPHQSPDPLFILSVLQDTVDLTNKEIERNGKEARYLQTKASLMKVAIDALAEAKQTVTAAKATTDALPLESKVANGLESQKLLKDAKALFKKWDPNGKGLQALGRSGCLGSVVLGIGWDRGRHSGVLPVCTRSACDASLSRCDQEE